MVSVFWGTGLSYIPYRLKKTLFLRKPVIHYQCPGCNHLLEATIEEAGLHNYCTTCNAVFIVPGAELCDEKRRAQLAVIAEKQERILEAKRERKLAATAWKLQEQEWARQKETQQKLAEATRKRVKMIQENKRLKKEEVEQRRREEHDRRKRFESARSEGYYFFEDEGVMHFFDVRLKDWREATANEIKRLHIALRGGYRFVEIDGQLYIYFDAKGAWRSPTSFERACVRQAQQRGGRPWFDGPIISRNYGSIIVPPFMKADGTKVVGHTKNPPGEGPADLRENARNISHSELAAFKY